EGGIEPRAQARRARELPAHPHGPGRQVPAYGLPRWTCRSCGACIGDALNTTRVEAIHAVLAVMDGHRPKDGIEAQLIAQLTVAHQSPWISLVAPGARDVDSVGSCARVPACPL